MITTEKYKFKIENDFNEELNSEEIKKYIEKKYNSKIFDNLNFSNYFFNKKLIDLPEFVNKLVLRNSFNNIMDIDILNNIKEIYFSKHFKQKILEFPKNIEKININCYTNKSYIIIVPKTVKIIIRCGNNISNEEQIILKIDPLYCFNLYIDLRLISKVKEIILNYELIKHNISYYILNNKIEGIFNNREKIKFMTI